MKRGFKIAIGVFAGIFVIIGLLVVILFSVLFTQGGKYDESSKKFIDSIIPKIISEWDYSVFCQYLHPNMLSAVSKEDFEASDIRKELGEFVSYDSSEGEANIKNINGKTTIDAEYVSKFTFENGNAVIMTQLFYMNKNWLITSFNCRIAQSHINFSAYSPMEYADFIKIFESTGNNDPGMSFFEKTSLRVHAILHEFPKELDDADIDNIQYTLRSVGFNPNVSSEFGYKVEYVFPSNVEWQEETRLVFYIQKVQRRFFDTEYILNDPIYWFLVFSHFNTFTQKGYFLISDFINEEQFVEFALE